MALLAGIPLKDFDLAKGRLSPDMSPDTRQHLARETARRVLLAAGGAGFEVAVVTPSPDVRSWAEEQGVAAIDEPPRGGLDAAADAVASRGPWCIIHADLPLVSSADLGTVARLLDDGRAVLAPSRDGGTNVFAAPRPLPFSYGTASFARHLAAAASCDPVVVVTPGLCVEIDTVRDVTGAARLPGGAWLADYLR